MVRLAKRASMNQNVKDLLNSEWFVNTARTHTSVRCREHLLFYCKVHRIWMLVSSERGVFGVV